MIDTSRGTSRWANVFFGSSLGMRDRAYSFLSSILPMRVKCIDIDNLEVEACVYH